MRIRETRDFDKLKAIWSRNPMLHVYELGDLDPEWRGECRFFCDDAYSHAAALFMRPAPSVAMFFTLVVNEQARRFARAFSRLLPDVVSAHVTAGLLDCMVGFVPGDVAREWRMSRHGTPPTLTDHACQTLGPEHLGELRAMLRAANPDHYLESDALSTGVFRGARNASGELIAAGGVHVLSEAESVACLGNIAVLPAFRGQGYGRRVTEAVLQALPASIEIVGLNVLGDNAPAIGLYEKLGFEKQGEFDIAEMRRQTP